MSDEQIFVLKEIPLIEKCLDIIESCLAQSSLNRVEIAGVGTLLQNAYSGIESILRCQVTERKIPFLKAENWHQLLLNSALANGLVTEDEFGGLNELRKFRHLHIHGYAHQLDEARLRELALHALDQCHRYLLRLRGLYK